MYLIKTLVLGSLMCLVLVHSDAEGAEGSGGVREVTTLVEAVSLVLGHSPSLASAYREHEAAENRRKGSAALSNPEFEVEAENLGATGSFRGEDGAEWTAKLKKRFNPWGKYRNEVGLARLDEELSRLDREELRLETERQVRMAYLEVWLAQETLQLRERSRALSVESHEQARRRVLAGDVSPIDSVRTEMGRVRAGLDADRALSELELARWKMEMLWGPDANARMGEAAAPPDPKGITNWEQWQKRLPNSPAWQRADMETSRLELEMAREKTSRIPGFEISGGIKTHENTRGHAWTGGVAVPLPLLNWNRPAILAARKQWEAGRKKQEAHRLRQTQELREAHTRALNSEKRYRATRDRLLPAARASHDGSLEGYRAGKYSGLLLLEARREWLEAELDYLQTTRDYHRAVLDLRHLAGTPAAEKVNIEERTDE